MNSGYTAPVTIGLASSFDTNLVQQSARIAANEASADGINWTFSPMVDISRDPRWGRVAEGGGEDPYLGSQMAKSMVFGYQGKDLSLKNFKNDFLVIFKNYADKSWLFCSHNTALTIFFPFFKFLII